MRWWWPARRRRRTIERGPYGRVPDGDMVPVPGYPTWADLLRDSLDEPTAAYRTVRVPPWIARGGGR
jgi:hypothetical protein